MMNKKILIVYPHNFFKRSMGIDSRYYELIRYYRSRDFEVDLLSLKNFVSSWEEQNPQESNLLNELFLYDFAEGYKAYSKKSKSNSGLMFEELPDYAFTGMKKVFETIIRKKSYDFILISYVYWANLIQMIPRGTSRFILDLSDFTTLNLFDMAEGKINLGRVIEDEIRLINLFDTVLCISEDEKWFFSQFSKRPDYYYVPHFMSGKPFHTDTAKEYDLLFIGSDNPFNKKGIHWFFEEIYPLLDASLKMVIVGKIASHISSYPNVTPIPYVADLNEIYNKSKIAICPLLGGTGIKIKVIEALSFGLPVVTTSKGVTGFPAKSNNGCIIADNAKDFAGSIGRLLERKDVYDAQSRLANQFFIQNFEKSVNYKTLDTLFLSNMDSGI